MPPREGGALRAPLQLFCSVVFCIFYEKTPFTARGVKQSEKVRGREAAPRASLIMPHDQRNKPTKGKATAEPQSPELSTAAITAKVVVLPLCFLSRQLDFDNLDNWIALQSVFATVMVAGYATLQLALRRARQRNDPERVLNPGSMLQFPDHERMADGAVSACTYDLAKLREAKKAFLMGAAVSCGLCGLCGWVMPMVVASVTLPLQLLDNKALMIYLRGHTYARPWGVAHADNPVRQWMEQKQEEGSRRKAA